MEQLLFFASVAIIGLGLWGLVWIVLNLGRTSRFRAWSAVPAAAPLPLPAERSSTNAGVLIASPGGRLLYLNERAREFFSLDWQPTTLARLARLADPMDAFLDLFISENATSFKVGNRRIEATSITLPDEAGQPRFMAVLQESQQRPELDMGRGAELPSTQTISVVSEIGRFISSNLDLTATLDTILQNLTRAFRYDIAEITLWDANAAVLRPARYAGNPDYERELARTGRTYYYTDEGCSGWLARQRTPLLISDVAASTTVRPRLQRADFPFRSYLGGPLIVNQQFLGTLEMVSYTVNTYQQNDLFLFNLIAAQAAVAIHNAQLFAEQQQRVAELSALADITRASESAADPRELYRRLTTDIARLMSVQIVSLLLYESAPTGNALIGQAPFLGMPDVVAELYNLSVAPGNTLDRLWQTNETWIVNDVPGDAAVDEIGFRTVAETAGVKTALLAPISIGGRRLGAVQVCNKTNDALFTAADARLLATFAGQAAAILENARLVAEAQTRAEQSEGLRSIAASIAASTDLDEILRATMRHIADLLHIDVGLISLLDEARGELRPSPASIYGDQPISAEALRMGADDPYFAVSVTRQRRTFMANNLAEIQQLSGIYRTACELYQIVSALAVPLTVGDYSLGEIVVGARRENAFSRTDQQLLATIAAQLTSGLERVRLYAATDQTLQRRVDQLTALTRVGRELNQTLELEHILRLVLDEVKRATNASCGSIVLLAEHSDTDTMSLEVSLRIGEEGLGDLLTPLEEEAITRAHGERALRVTDLPAQSTLAAHPEVRSALVVPIIVQGVVAGLIHLHSPQPQGFDHTTEEITAALAAQTAIAVNNFRRYDEQRQRSELLRRRADQLSQLFRISRAVRSDQPLTDNLETIAFGMQEAVGFNMIVISVLDTQTRRLRHTIGAGIPVSIFEQARLGEPHWEIVTRLFRDEFRISHSYFIPKERAANLGNVADVMRIMPPTENTVTAPNAWKTDDLFLVPLIGSGDEPLGLLALDYPRDGLRPDRHTAEIVEIFANQAALAIENARLYQAANRRAARLLALHRVIEHASRVADREQVWQAMAESMATEMGLDVCLIALVDEHTRQLAVRGLGGDFSSAEIDFASLLTAEAGEISLIASDRKPLLVVDTRATAWASQPLIMAVGVASFVSAPIVSQGEVIGVLFAGVNELPTPFSPEDVDLFVVLTNQLGAWLESARLEASTLAERGQHTAQLAALADVSRVITAALRTEDVVQTIQAPTGLRSVILYDSLTLWLREGNQLRIAAAQGFENNAERIGLRVDIADSALFAEMVQTTSAILVPDVHADPRFPAGAFLPTRSWLGAPLMSKGQIIGALVLDKTEPDAYSPQTAQVLLAFANQAAVAIDNARLFEENEQRTQEMDNRAQRLARLNRVSAQLGSTLDEKRIFDITLREVSGALNVHRALMLTFDELGRQNVAALIPSFSAMPSGFDIPNPALARVRETLTPLAIEDVAKDTLLASTRSIFIARGVKSLLILPLVVAGKPVAILQMEETAATRHFTPAEIELAQTLANQAAVAVQNARLYNETQTRLTELATLNQISRAISATIDIEQVYQTVREQVTGVMGVDSIYLALYDENQDLISFPLVMAHGQSLKLEPRPPSGLIGRIIESRESLLIGGDLEPGAEQLEQFGALQGTQEAIRSYLGAPLIIGERVIGVLAVQDSEHTNVFTAGHERLLTIIAAQVAVAVENARFAQELESRVEARTQDLERARERVETLLQITTELSSSLDLDLVLARTLQLVTDAVRAPQGSIYLLDMETNQLIYRAALGRPIPLPTGGELAPFKPSDGLVGWVMKNRQGAVISDLADDPRWMKIPGSQYSHKSALAVPLMAGEDALGAMLMFSPHNNAFDEEQLRLVIAAANQVGAAINNAELYRLIRDQAERLGGMLRGQQVEATKSRAILEGIADGVLVTDDNGNVILFNAACERILALPRDKVIGRPVTEFVGIYGAAGKAWLDAIHHWSRTPTSYRAGEYFSERVDLSDQRIISVHLAPVTTGDEYLGSVSVIRDITQEVEVDRLKSEFVTNVSHELRTPMTSIKGYADILLMGASGTLTPQQAHFLEVIKNNADRLSILVNDLLDISHIESGRVELMRRPLEIRGIIQAVVDNLKGRVTQANKPMQLQIDVPAGLPTVWGDSERVTQMIMNLGDNAFNYSHPNSTITLKARADLDKQEMTVEVQDTGIGIAPEDQPRLFSRFYRGEDALVLATAGNGLGLSIARQLAEMHGGRVWLATSEVGQGSTFAVALPLTTPEQASQALGAELAHPAAGKHMGR